jgi:hypothetical protein
VRRNLLLLGSSAVLVLAVVGAVLTTGVLDKSGQFGDGRVNFTSAPVANCGAAALLASPLLTHLALCIRWHHDRRLAAVGLLTVAISCGVTLWGNLADYLAWSRLPPPRDQVTYLGGFFAMLGSWCACAAYVLAGLAYRFVGRRGHI